jgi:methyl-accepting chemotaxis protein
MGGTLMHGTIELRRQTESSDGEMSGEHLGTLLRQVSKASMGEIESLIVELKTLHKKLQTDGDRIQHDVEEHAELSQQVVQLTKIISDSVKKLPGRS